MILPFSAVDPADAMDLDTFVDRYARHIDRDSATGRYGHWHNPIGHWEWWDLDGRLDGFIIGDPARASSRITTPISSGESRGRTLLTNLEDQLGKALDQAPPPPTPPTVDIQTNRNIELVTTLLTDAQAAQANAYPGALVLPPGTPYTRFKDHWAAAVGYHH